VQQTASEDRDTGMPLGKEGNTLDNRDNKDKDEAVDTQDEVVVMGQYLEEVVNPKPWEVVGYLMLWP